MSFNHINRLPLYPTAPSSTPNKFQTPTIKNLELSLTSLTNKTPTPSSEANILASKNCQIKDRKLYFENNLEHQKSINSEEDFYNYHNSNKLLFKKVNKTNSNTAISNNIINKKPIQLKEEIVLKEISQKIHSQQNQLFMEDPTPGSTNKKLKNNLRNLLYTENFLNQSLNCDLEGMMEKVDSLFGEEYEGKNNLENNNNSSDSFSVFSVPTNIYANRHFSKEDSSSFLQPYSEMDYKFNEGVSTNKQIFIGGEMDGLEQINSIKNINNNVKNNNVYRKEEKSFENKVESECESSNPYHEKNIKNNSSLNLSHNNFNSDRSNDHIEKNTKSTSNYHYENNNCYNNEKNIEKHGLGVDEEIKNLKEAVHQLQLKDAIQRQTISKLKKQNEESKSQAAELQNKYNLLFKQREKDIEYIKQLDTQIIQYENKKLTNLSMDKYEHQIKAQNDIINNLLSQNKTYKVKNKELEQVLKNILFEKEIKGKLKNTQGTIHEDSFNNLRNYECSQTEETEPVPKNRKRSKSELQFKKERFRF